MITLGLVLLVCALVAFFLATINTTSQFNLTALGLLFLTIYYMVGVLQ